MLVCSVSLRPPRHAIAAALVETAAADDASTTGQVVFAALVDDPASVSETVDAYLGEIMLEAASAADDVNAGFASAVAIAETTTAADTPDATVSGAVATTWNPSDKTTPVVLGSGNLRVTTGGSATNGGVRSTTSKTTGKVYLEYTCTNLGGANTGCGIATGSAALATMGSTTVGVALVYFSGSLYFNGSQVSTLPGVTGGSVVCVAIDVTSSLLWMRVNGGNWNGSGTANPATGVGGINIASLFPSNAVFAAVTVNATNADVTANFGGSAFAQTVPSGFVAWG